MMFKTLTGIEFAGAMGGEETLLLKQVREGESFDVYFDFTCRMTQGDYFLNVGFLEKQFGAYRFIHRIVDALHVKVQEGKRAHTTKPLGFMDVGIDCQITPLP
jgi:lipopolysaccharide transport system ATP-binding protein